MDPGAETDRPATGQVRAATRWLLTAFAALTLLAVLQLLVLSDVSDRYWAWPIHTELTAAFLGAAYGAGFVLSVAARRQHDWGHIRVPLLTVTAFTWLTAAPTLVHLHRLHLLSGGPFARVAAWVWLTVYLVIPLVSVVVVAHEERRRERDHPVLHPMPGWLRWVLRAEGAVLGFAGVVLYLSGMRVHHGEPSNARFWPWALMPLSAQVIGAWLVALALATALAVGQRDLEQLLVSAMTYTAFGVLQAVAVIWYWPQLERHDLWLFLYLAVLAAMTATGAYGWWAARQSRAVDALEGPPVTGPAAGAGARHPAR